LRRGGRERHLTAAMPDGVVDEVDQRLLDAKGIHVGDERLGVDPCAETTRHLLHEVGDVRLLRLQRNAPVIRAREQEEVFGKTRQARRAFGRGGERGAELVRRARTSQRKLEPRREQSERRAQLMARIGDEAPFAEHTTLDASEHRVERLTEARDLVTRVRHG
jgi:hypothetical protein